MTATLLEPVETSSDPDLAVLTYTGPEGKVHKGYHKDDPAAVAEAKALFDSLITAPKAVATTEADVVTREFDPQADTHTIFTQSAGG